MEMLEGEESGEKHQQWFPTSKMNEEMMLSPVICLIVMVDAVLFSDHGNISQNAWEIVFWENNASRDRVTITH